MKFDISTMLGVLGVSLTILFFVIGYRQTIGARKERARAANKGVTDALLRRIALEQDFTMELATIEKLLGGWALDSRVRPADMLSPEDVEAVILARIIESDYIAASQRKDVIQRLERCFKESAPAKRLPKTSRVSFKFGPEASLGLASALLGLGVSVALIQITVRDSGISTSESTLSFSLAAGLMSILATAVGLIFYVRTRDASRSTVDIAPSTSVRESMLFENKVMEEIKKIAPQARMKSGTYFDYDIEFGGERILLETRNRLFRMPRNLIARTVDRLKSELEKVPNARALLVIGDDRIPDLNKFNIDFGPIQVVTLDGLPAAFRAVAN